MGRRVPEAQILGEVKPTDQRPRALQDDPEPDRDVDDLEVIAGVVAGAGSLEQFELLAEGLKEILLSALNRRCRRPALLPCHADKASNISPAFCLPRARQPARTAHSSSRARQRSIADLPTSLAERVEGEDREKAGFLREAARLALGTSKDVAVELLTRLAARSAGLG
jgi:hypothetical protein